MKPSDDPTGGVITAAIIGAGVREGVKAVSGQTSIFGRKSSSDRSARTAISATDSGMETKTADPVEALSKSAKDRRRREASTLGRQFAPPTLGIPALTGA